MALCSVCPWFVRLGKLENHRAQPYGDPPGFHRPPPPPPPPPAAVPYNNNHNPNHHHHHHHHHNAFHGGGFAGDPNYHYNHGPPPGDYGGGFAGDSNFHQHHHHPAHNYSNPHHHPHQNHQQPNHHYNAHSEHQPQSNGGGSNGPPPSAPLPVVRKRGFHSSGRGFSQDFIDGVSLVKLYVGFVSRTATEQEIRPFFEEFGHVVEVVLLKDKASGQQKGSCFVKYATIGEADRAIKALNNQCTFPGENAPMQIRYADGERERLGTREFKLYVGCLNKQASRKDIEEIFSLYGHVEDVYILRDERKQSRGFGFIKYSHRDMAVAAISALNGNYFMKGCDQPLIVRFADSKKPKTAESRSNSVVGSSSFHPHPQESVRPAENRGGPLDQHMVPDNSYPSNTCPLVHQISTGSQPEAVSEMPNQAAPCFMQQPLQQPQHYPSELPQMSLQPPQVLQETSVSSQDLVSEKQAQLHQIQPSTQNMEQQQDVKVNLDQIGDKTQAHSSSTTPSATVASPITVVDSAVLVDLPDCNWSEHICPDGYRYYYNCINCESRWEKPEEFILFEQHLKKQQQKLSTEDLLSRSGSHNHCSQKDSQTQGVKLQRDLPRQKFEFQQSSFSASEFVREQTATTSAIPPTCVQ